MAIFTIVGALRSAAYTQLFARANKPTCASKRVARSTGAHADAWTGLAQLDAPDPSVSRCARRACLPCSPATRLNTACSSLALVGATTAGLARRHCSGWHIGWTRKGHWRDHCLSSTTLTVEPTRANCSGGVRSVNFRFLNANRDWVDRWPASDGPAAADDRVLPAAVEVTTRSRRLGPVAAPGRGRG